MNELLKKQLLENLQSFYHKIQLQKYFYNNDTTTSKIQDEETCDLKLNQTSKLLRQLKPWDILELTKKFIDC